MKKHFKTLSVSIALLLAGASAFAAKAGEVAPTFTVTGVSGEQISLADHKGKIVVLEWTNYDCPFVKKFYESGQMQRLQKKYADEGVVWYTICSSAEGKQGYGTAAEWKERFATSKPAAADLLIDSEGTVGRAYNATATPQFAIIDAEGTLIYNGAIDNIPSFRQSDIEKAQSYIVPVLDALVAGEAVTPSNTTAYGCGVKY